MEYLPWAVDEYIERFAEGHEKDEAIKSAAL
jgi:hypothetical protein